MKSILFFPLTFLAFSCSSKKIENSNLNTNNIKIENQCPENVDCNFEIIPDKSLNVITDGIGMLYYELEENPNKVVFKYQYKLKTDEDLQDAGYLEEVLFEMDKNYTDFAFSGKDIQSTKILLNVMCFCRGKAGSYKITDGSISKKGKSLSITIPKIVDNQKISDIKIKL